MLLSLETGVVDGIDGAMRVSVYPTDRLEVVCPHQWQGNDVRNGANDRETPMHEALGLVRMLSSRRSDSLVGEMEVSVTTPVDIHSPVSWQGRSLLSVCFRSWHASRRRQADDSDRTTQWPAARYRCGAADDRIEA